MGLNQDIINGDYDAELTQIYKAANYRLKMLKEVKVATIKSTLSVGDVVMLNGLKPAYLNGKEATVVQVNRKRVVVNMVEQIARFGPECTVPLQCVSLKDA